MSYSKETYLKIHRDSGLKVGDRVRVTRAAEDYELGWDDEWAHPHMKVGESRIIQDNAGYKGFRLDDDFDYPAFVLEKVEEVEEEENLREEVQVIANREGLPNGVHEILILLTEWIESNAAAIKEIRDGR